MYTKSTFWPVLLVDRFRHGGIPAREVILEPIKGTSSQKLLLNQLLELGIDRVATDVWVMLLEIVYGVPPPVTPPVMVFRVASAFVIGGIVQEIFVDHGCDDVSAECFRHRIPVKVKGRLDFICGILCAVNVFVFAGFVPEGEVPIEIVRMGGGYPVSSVL